MTPSPAPALTFPALRDALAAAGVVGMGGGGFPTHLKLRPSLNLVIINGAECEPLLRCDYHLLRHHAAEVLSGAVAVATAAGAAGIVLAIKAKNQQLGAAFEGMATPVPFRPFHLADVYPSGDEFFVIRDAAGVTLSAGAIPVDEGIFVGNAATFKAVADALQGQPLTRRYVSVSGAVRQPFTAEVAFGTPFDFLLELAGGAMTPGCRILEGGVMMGALARADSTVTKTTSALVVLPADHSAVLERTRPLSYSVKAAEHACCQCAKCTELCSRYLLGHDLEPHKLMRLVGSARDYRRLNSQVMFNCSGCGLCSLIACPFDLSPRRLILEARRSFTRTRPASPPPPEPRPQAGLFTMPTSRLAGHLKLDSFDPAPPFRENIPIPPLLRISLRQNAGAPAIPLVSSGDTVQKDQLIARAPDGAMGAVIHAPVAGRVVGAETEIVLETAL